VFACDGKMFLEGASVWLNEDKEEYYFKNNNWKITDDLEIRVFAKVRKQVFLLLLILFECFF
jgi:hypothetical protein